MLYTRYLLTSRGDSACTNALHKVSKILIFAEQIFGRLVLVNRLDNNVDALIFATT